MIDAPPDMPFKCGKHGHQATSQVCAHTIRTLKDGKGRGFYWSDDGRTGWCQECEDYRNAMGGEWSPRVQKYMDVRLLCAVCFDNAKRHNGFD